MDYLLHDDYESDSDIPIVKEVTVKAKEREKEYGKHSLFSIICWFTAFFCYVIASAINVSVALAAFTFNALNVPQDMSIIIKEKYSQRRPGTNVKSPLLLFSKKFEKLCKISSSAKSYG